MIEIKHLRKAYPDAVPLEDVNVTINKGDVIAIIGPSGTGKSTLIRCINQLDTPTSGAVIFDEKDLTDPLQYDEITRRRIGMVFQSYNLFLHMTVLENVTFVPIYKQKIPPKEAYNKALGYLKMVGMADKLYSYPSQLSGGQMQRVAIARTLATEPEIILLDEPTSALDPTMAGEVEAVIHQLAEKGTTMMIVTHSMDLARNVANRVFYMDQGGIYEEGTPEQIFEHPIKERTRAFVEKGRVLKIEINTRNHDFIGSVNKIDNFTFKHRISKKTAQHIQLIFEEICINELMQHFLNEPWIKVGIEYNEKLSEVCMRIEYVGDKYNVFEECDPISRLLTERYSENARYSFECNEKFANKLELTVV